MRALDSTVHVLGVKQPDGSLTRERLVVSSSVHGPIVAATDSSALALRVVGLDQPHMVDQTWQMLRARNLSEFETALARLQLPMFTVLYADRRGHILHVFNGQVPIRAGGDWRYYHFPAPADPPAAWKLTFTRTQGDAALYIRDTIPPGSSASGSSIRYDNTDAKNSGPYQSGGYTQSGTITYANPLLRSGHDYWVGVRAGSDAQYSLTSSIEGSLAAIPVLVLSTPDTPPATASLRLSRFFGISGT